MQRSHREVGALMHQERVHSEVGNGAIKDDERRLAVLSFIWRAGYLLAIKSYAMNERSHRSEMSSAPVSLFSTPMLLYRSFCSSGIFFSREFVLMVHPHRCDFFTFSDLVKSGANKESGAEDVHGTYVPTTTVLVFKLKAGSKPKQCKKEEAALAMNVSCSLSASPMS